MTPNRSELNATTMAAGWIAQFDPDVIIIEDPKTATRKGRTTTARIRSMLRVAERTPAMVAKARRVQMYKNAYAEAQALVEAFPQMVEKLPVRRFYDSEPRSLVLFEALALAQVEGFLRQA